MCSHVDKSLENCLHRPENPISFERKLPVDETTTAMDGSRGTTLPIDEVTSQKARSPQRLKKEGDNNSNRGREDSAYGFGEYAFKTNPFF